MTTTTRRSGGMTPMPTPATRSVQQPETLREAHRHGTITELYREVEGLCTRCAAQAAYGHQLGFSALEHQPCDRCTPIVAALPKSQANGWRSVAGDASDRRNHDNRADK